MTKNTTYRYGFDGMPTGPDVTRLLKEWPKLKVGDEITDEEITEVVGLRREGKSKTRFTSIELAWMRKLQRDHNTILRRVRGENKVKVLSVSEICTRSGEAMQKAARGLRRQRRECAAVIPETDRDRSELVHRMQFLSMAERATKDTHKKMLLPAPAPQPQKKLSLVGGGSGNSGDGNGNNGDDQ